jgi:hypothetical protein
MKFYSAAIVLSSFIAQTLAQFSITQPVTGVVWKTNDQVLIQWQPADDGKDPSFQPSTIVIDLFASEGNSSVFVLNICKNLPGDRFDFNDYKVPSNLVSAVNAYSIKMTVTGKDGKKKILYSSPFSIESQGTGNKGGKGAPNGGFDAGKNSAAKAGSFIALTSLLVFATMLLQ